MKLYYTPGLCSQAPHIVLREAGIPYTLERVDTDTHKTEHGIDYYTINSKGQTPVLKLENGELLTEGAIISQYVGDKAGRHDLMPPAGTVARYRVMEWQNYVATELHKGYAPLFNPDVDAPNKAILVAALRKKFEWVSNQLHGKQYLTGDAFTAADAYLFVVSGWAKYVNLDLSGLTELQSFLKRVAARPAVREVLKAEGLLN